jgi:hypothetical protein
MPLLQLVREETKGRPRLPYPRCQTHPSKAASLHIFRLAIKFGRYCFFLKLSFQADFSFQTLLSMHFRQSDPIFSPARALLMLGITNFSSSEEELYLALQPCFRAGEAIQICHW